jgi:hypothetical protein
MGVTATSMHTLMCGPRLIPQRLLTVLQGLFNFKYAPSRVVVECNPVRSIDPLTCCLPG